MVLTPLRITKVNNNTKGTGRVDGEEVFPCTLTLMNRLHANKDIVNKVITAQQSKYKSKLKDSTIKDLRPYQIEDIKFLAARKNAGCFNEQRTGKTPTILRVIKEKNLKKILIVCPASIIYKWQEECRRWTDLDCVVVDGTAKKRQKIIEDWKQGGLVISYECLREVTRYNKNKNEYTLTGDLSYIKKHKDIDACILDEAHRIKNHKSKQAEAMFSLSYIPHKYALTGTPAQNKQYEIYSILHWLYPTIFTGYWRFIDYYFNKETVWTNRRDFIEITNFQKGKDTELQEFLNTISTRRLRASVMNWLPNKDYEVIRLDLDKKQKEYIDELRTNFEIEDTEVNAINILDRLIKERQICLGPQVLDLKGISPKLEWIKQYIKDYPDKQILIFSNFTKWLKYLSKELNCPNLIIGETNKLKREQLKNDFQCGKIKLLLLNIKAAKEGITLDSASVAIFTDKYPPVGDILQAEDRFVATTKDKKDIGHTIIDLVMKESYEEQILNLLKSNASDIDVVNNYINYLKGEN